MEIIVILTVNAPSRTSPYILPNTTRHVIAITLEIECSYRLIDIGQDWIT